MQLSNRNPQINLKIVPVNEIPAQSVSCSLDVKELIFITNAFIQMQNLCEDHQGIGLAAVQVGINKKFFIVKEQSGEYNCYINCEYENISDKQVDSVEGCLSIKDQRNNLKNFIVPRFEKIKVTGKKLILKKDLLAEDFVQELTGLYAVVFAHEIDHQNNILISDIGKEIVLKTI